MVGSPTHQDLCSIRSWRAGATPAERRLTRAGRVDVQATAGIPPAGAGRGGFVGDQLARVPADFSAGRLVAVRPTRLRLVRALHAREPGSVSRCLRPPVLALLGRLAPSPFEA